MKLKSGRIALPICFPTDVAAEANTLLDNLSGEIKSHEDFVSTCKGTITEDFWKEGLKIYSEAWDALERLFTDDTIMPPIWDDIAQHYPDKFLILPMGIFTAYDKWHLQRPKNSPDEREKQLVKLAKQMEKLAFTIADSPDLKFLLDSIFFSMFTHEIEVKHSPITGLQPYREYILQDSTHSPDSEILSPRIDAYAIVNNIARALSIPLHGLTKHKPKSDFPRKLKGESAERTYFIRAIAAAVKVIYGQKNYARVAEILSVIRTDCANITESDISKNTR